MPGRGRHARGAAAGQLPPCGYLGDKGVEEAVGGAEAVVGVEAEHAPDEVGELEVVVRAVALLAPPPPRGPAAVDPEHLGGGGGEKGETKTCFKEKITKKEL